MNNNIIIAIDGPAGSGKSSVAREIATRLGLTYIDSGALYRAITWFILRQAGTIPQGIDFVSILDGIDIRQRFNPDGSATTTVNGYDVSREIRDERITKNIGRISDDLPVRNFVTDLLRRWAARESVIMDGRDIGTVVFPDADCKIYLDASVDVRAVRRVQEYTDLGKSADLEAIKNQIIHRDQADRARPVGGLKQAPDAIYMDSSGMGKEAVIKKIIEIVEQKTETVSLSAGRTFSGTLNRNYNMENHTNNNFDDISMEQVVNATQNIVPLNTIIQAEIVTMDHEYAFINIGSKSEGRVSLHEFDIKPAIGDNIDVMLLDRHLMDGMFVFSKAAADQQKSWSSFIENYKKGDHHISGKVTGSVKNGFTVQCNGLEAFLPFSQAGDIKAKAANELTAPFTFIIKNVDHKNRSMVVSRRDYLDEQRELRWNSFVQNHQVNQCVKGRVIKYIEEGALIDIDGQRSVLHKDDISWKNVFKKKDILKTGDIKDFMILDINTQEKTVRVGLKQLCVDPWTTVQERYHTGDTIKGTVITVTNFGAFVEIEDGVEGLISSDNISWTKKNVNPKNIFQTGQQLDAQILDIDIEKRRLSLGIKQLAPNPWDSIAERFPVGSVHTSTIKKITTFGMFIGLEDGIDGMIHVSDITWDNADKNPLSSFHEGDTVEFKIIEINRKEMKIAGGIKQLKKSPWDIIKEKYKPRSKVSGVVSGLVSFGVFVKLEDGVEGLVHISEASKKKIATVEEAFKIGDTVHAVVLGVDSPKKRLSLSIKQYESIEEKEELSKVLNMKSSNKVTLGDLMKKSLSGE